MRLSRHFLLCFLLVPTLAHANAVMNAMQQETKAPIVADLFTKGVYAPPYQSTIALQRIQQHCAHHFQANPQWKTHFHTWAKQQALMIASGSLESESLHHLIQESGGLNRIGKEIEQPILSLLSLNSSGKKNAQALLEKHYASSDFQEMTLWLIALTDQPVEYQTFLTCAQADTYHAAFIGSQGTMSAAEYYMAFHLTQMPSM